MAVVLNKQYEMKFMDIPREALGIRLLCDLGMVFSLCALIFFLPISIALVDSFAALVILFYAIKKINEIILSWKLKTSGAKISHKISYIINGLGPIPSILNRPIEILALMILVSVFQSQFFGLSMYAFWGKFLKGVFLYFSFIEVFTEHKHVRLFLYVFALASFLIAVSGVIQHFSGMDFLRGRQLSGGRVSSSFRYGNSFGTYLIVILGMVVQQFYFCITNRRSFLMQMAWGALLCMLALCLTWTYSRASWVGFIASMIFLISLDKRKIIYLISLLLIFLCFSLPALSIARHVSLTRDDITNTSYKQMPKAASKTKDVVSDIKPISSKEISKFFSQGGSGRTSFWHSAISIIEKYPIWGSGLNTYTRMLQRFSLPLWYAHNCYLQMAAEIGFIGLGCFLWMLFVLYSKGLYTLQTLHDPWLNALLQGALGGLFGYLVECFLDNSLYTVQLGILFWIMLGLVGSIINLNRYERTLCQDL